MVVTKNTNFLEDGIKEILGNLSKNKSKIDRNILLDLIRKTAPVTIYKLAKETGFSYSSIQSIVREFEFCGLVKYRVVLGDNNRTHKLIVVSEDWIIPEKDAEKENSERGFEDNENKN